MKDRRVLLQPLIIILQMMQLRRQESTPVVAKLARNLPKNKLGERGKGEGRGMKKFHSHKLQVYRQRDKGIQSVLI